MKTLTEMAVEVYNDSKSLTLAAWSWPGRSLANLHAQQQFYALIDSDNVQSFTLLSQVERNFIIRIQCIMQKCWR